ncbi:MAG: tripartite tricarboxylate transporter permease [Saprospiraceae bacterium]|jgi:putative tricarboxylic transport membrane protein|nr:tripartite tricarboxylate transporter permease [Saprospiraceae bacterium]MDP4820934.1 tripartite tricarboxylate transporter permease [Saprospiraceae bacterium]MDP4998250.1 tripartite tricarboxylate transporter permease [Saprospiraceae bacterium]
MFDAALEGLQIVLEINHLMYMCAGILMGLVVGIFPGLGGIVGLSLLLPFVYGMNDTEALAMMVGLVAVIPTSDTFTSVLMGIPGSNASQATVLDGYPLSQQGQASRALSAAFFASMFGGLLGALVLTIFLVFARGIILSFGTPELFMLSILGLSMVGVISGNNILKGLVSCGLGMLVASIGSAPATAEERMTFSSLYLFDGLPLVVVGLGIFALPEIIDLLKSNTAISGVGRLSGSWMQGIRDAIRYRWLCFRSAVVGAIIGAIPGLGGSVVDWIAYGFAMQSAKDKSQFGKGDIRGVLGPESANNAKEGGALIPTLLFGIPGSGNMAIFLGGLILIGLEPGPAMAKDDLDISYAIIWSLALANLIGAGLCLLIARPVSLITRVPYPILAPLMILVITFAAFQSTRDFGDLVALLVIGVIAYFMKKYHWSRPAFLIGFVLAEQTETYLYQALQFYEWSFLTRPGVWIIFVLIIASTFVGYRFLKTEKDKAREEALSLPVGPDLLFAGLLLVFNGIFLYQTGSLSFTAGIFPLGVTLVNVLLLTGIGVQAFRKTAVLKTQGNFAYFPAQAGDPRFRYFFGWWLGYYLLIALLGFFPATAIFVVAFLFWEARLQPRTLIGIVLGTALFLWILATFLKIEFPQSLLF